MRPEDKTFIHNLWMEQYQYMKYRAHSLGINDEDADDVIIDCFLNLIKVIPTLQKLTSEELRAYISIVIRNQCQRWHYINERVVMVPLEGENLFVLREGQLTEDAVISKIDSERKTALLLDSLNERDKLLLFGHYIEGKTDDELSKMLQCKKNSIRSLLSRARKNAREILIHKKGDDPNG